MTTTKTTDARIENPYFVRVELYSPMDGWDTDETRTLVKAFATKQEAWEYVKKMDAQYNREVVTGGSTFWVSIKIQRNWQTLWQA